MKKISLVLFVMIVAAGWSCRNHDAPQKSDANGIGAKAVPAANLNKHS